MIEIWKNIKNYEGYYQVSNFGNIKSLSRFGQRTERVLKPAKSSRGYLQVSLFKNCVCKHIHVHRLVAEAFIENINNFPEINHKDENKENNKVENLEWCTSKYNSNYGQRNNRINTIIKGNPVLQYSMNGDFIKEYSSAFVAKKETKIDNSLIIKACEGKYYDNRTNKYYSVNHAGGFKWKYKYERSKNSFNN